MADEIEFRIEGFDSLTVGLRGLKERIADELREAVSESLDAAHKVMVAEVPRGETLQLANSIKLEDVHFVPGGAGGGGVHEGSLSVGEGVDHLNLVVEGTGVHGVFGGDGGEGPIVAGTGNIRPKGSSGFYQRKGAAVMHWTRGGKDFFAKSVKGQEPQTRWIEDSRAAANAVAARKIREIDALRQG